MDSLTQKLHKQYEGKSLEKMLSMFPNSKENKENDHVWELRGTTSHKIMKPTKVKKVSRIKLTFISRGKL